MFFAGLRGFGRRDKRRGGRREVPAASARLTRTSRNAFGDELSAIWKGTHTLRPPPVAIVVGESKPFAQRLARRGRFEGASQVCGASHLRRAVPSRAIGTPTYAWSLLFRRLRRTPIKRVPDSRAAPSGSSGSITERTTTSTFPPPVEGRSIDCPRRARFANSVSMPPLLTGSPPLTEHATCAVASRTPIATSCIGHGEMCG